MKKVLFIVNPISGNGAQRTIGQHIEQYLDQTRFVAEIAYTQHPKHATQISQEAASSFDYVMAVGGDGSVNEIGRGLIGSAVTMGVLPYGSGNGLARFLGIPMGAVGALKLLAEGHSRRIDTLTANDEVVLNVAGVGFDAHISHCFAQHGARGFASYIKLTISEYWRYQPKEYELIVDGKTYRHRALLVSFANSSQFGNNAHIAPHAQIDDGLIDVTVIEPIPSAYAVVLGARLFLRNLHQSGYYHGYRGRRVEVRCAQPMPGHVDGEPVQFGERIRFDVNARSLNVLVP